METTPIPGGDELPVGMAKGLLATDGSVTGRHEKLSDFMQKSTARTMWAPGGQGTGWWLPAGGKLGSCEIQVRDRMGAPGQVTAAPPAGLDFQG